MPQKVTINVPLNRVEGDLEIRAEIEGGVVTDAWSCGTMYRGFENIMVGRGALDGLVITPRICGICSTSHLLAAARALDMIAGVDVPPDATRVRNLALMTEHIQSDLRHAFLMFAVDFVNPAYAGRPFFDEAVRRFEPFRGSSAIGTIRATRKMLEVVAILGGQWPHSSFMVPGGIVSVPSPADLLQCRMLLNRYRSWYENDVLGCTIDRWGAIASVSDLDAWLAERAEHRDADLGFLLRICRELGLDRTGRGHGNYLSVGAFDYPPDTTVERVSGQSRVVAAGVLAGGAHRNFDPALLGEHVAHSWYEDYEGGRHPFEGETKPFACGGEGKKYSWAKAPRYDDLPIETGPLAEALVGRAPLFMDLVAHAGTSVMARQLARLARPARFIPIMERWLEETRGDGKFYTAPGPIVEGDGFGLVQAARGALGHFVKVRRGAISHYQIITPTAWNASPRDSRGTRGPLEQALVSTGVKDPENPVELGHVVRSFDACLVCTVHALKAGKTTGKVRVATT